MATATVGTTFTNANFVGPLFHLTPKDTPFFSMIGGMNGDRNIASSFDHTWQTDDNLAAAATAVVEGADPTYAERTRTEVSNIVQIFQYGVEVTYGKQSATGQLGAWTTRTWAVLGNQPVQDELARQLMLKMARMKRDIEYSMLRGSYSRPSTNTTARTMRGMRNAISTNSRSLFTSIGACTFDVTGGASEDLWTKSTHGLAVGDEVMFTAVGTGAEGYAVDTPYWVAAVPDANTFQLSATKSTTVLEGTGSDSTGTWTLQKAKKVTESDIEGLILDMVGQDAPFTQPVFLAGAYHMQRFSDMYGYAPMSRTYGGVAIDTVLLDIAGPVGVVFDRHMQPGELYLVDLSVCKPVFLPVPGKGTIFAEPVASTGAAWRYQLYGQVGLEYGPETWHGKIIGTTTAP